MAKRLTIPEILIKINKRLPEVVGIVESTYSNTQSVAIFVDRDYGEFQGIAYHLWHKGHGHPIRKLKEQRKKTIKSIEEIKVLIFKKHGNMVTIDEKSYTGIKQPATFVDKDFGEWKAVVREVANGSRHPKRWASLRTFDIETVKRKIFEAHDDIVSIKEETYTKSKDKATFVDKDFGEWSCTAILVWRGHGHPSRAKRTTEEEVQERILKIHGDELAIIKSSYSMVTEKAIFVDRELGQFECLVNSVLRGVGHPKRKNEKSEKTCLDRYGVKNASQVPEKALKAARKLNERFLRTYWETGEELICQASWEARVVDHLNMLKVRFIWQPTAFPMPDGQTYRPDFLDLDRNVWVEIKGLIRPKFVVKWDWFLTQFPNAELWDQKKLKELGIL
jgi:hypothetical protein